MKIKRITKQLYRNLDYSYGSIKHLLTNNLYNFSEKIIEIFREPRYCNKIKMIQNLL